MSYETQQPSEMMPQLAETLLTSTVQYNTLIRELADQDITINAQNLPEVVVDVRKQKMIMELGRVAYHLSKAYEFAKNEGSPVVKPENTTDQIPVLLEGIDTALESNDSKDVVQEEDNSQNQIELQKVIDELFDAEEYSDKEIIIIRKLVEQFVSGTWFKLGQLQIDEMFKNPSARNQVFEKLAGKLVKKNLLISNGIRAGGRKYRVSDQIVQKTSEIQSENPSDSKKK